WLLYERDHSPNGAPAVCVQPGQDANYLQGAFGVNGVARFFLCRLSSTWRSLVHAFFAGVGLPTFGRAGSRKGRSAPPVTNCLLLRTPRNRDAAAGLRGLERRRAGREDRDEADVVERCGAREDGSRGDLDRA